MALLQVLWDKARRNKKSLMRQMWQEAQEGDISDQQFRELVTRYRDLGLTQGDLDQVRIDVYTAAFAQVDEDKVVTPEEEIELDQLQRTLGFPESHIAVKKKELARLRVLREIEQGSLPTASVDNLDAQAGEVVHWCEPAQLVGEGPEGHLAIANDKSGQPAGNLVFTNQRVIFQHRSVVLAFALATIVRAQMYPGGIEISDARGKTYSFHIVDEANV